MGIGIGVSRCGCNDGDPRERTDYYDVQEAPPKKKPKNPEPNPINFKILRYFSTDTHAALELLYPDCENYGGIKVCVYNKNIRAITTESFLDPHFCEGEHLSPIARMEPTDYGWEMAIYLVERLSKE